MGEIVTEYGQYRFNLGPGEDGRFHELKCLGMSEVTTEFPKYDLAEICNEFKENADDEDLSTILPSIAKGSRVHLLVGIKNNNLHPTLLKVLPSGIGVFLSPFKDIFGSRIVFAGPHKSFTQVNKETTANYIESIFCTRSNEDILYPEEDWKRDIISYSFTIDPELGLTMHPVPINEIDFMDAGCVVPEQLEDRVNDGEYLENLKKCFEHHLLSNNYLQAHKATIPIARLREMVDQEDRDDTASHWRCPTCAKCEKCKKAPRTNAISLQESMEQEIIESSVDVRIEERKVVVKLPFIKNPVQFLKEKHNARSNKKQALHVYKTQCRKSEQAKEGLRKFTRN